MLHISTVKLFSSNLYGFIRYISTSLAKIVKHCLIGETDRREVSLGHPVLTVNDVIILYGELKEVELDHKVNMPAIRQTFVN